MIFQNRTRICIIVPRLIGHGMERMAILCAESLAEEFDVEIITFSEKIDYSTSIPIFCIHAPSRSSKLGKIATVFLRGIRVFFYKRARKVKFSISFGDSANLINILTKIRGSKSIVSFRGFASITNGPIFKAICFFSDWILCNSFVMLSQLHTINLNSRLKSSVIYNGLDIEEIQKLSSEHVDFYPGSPAFVSVGRLEPVKGQRHLINAFYFLLKIMPHASLVIIGEGSERDKLIEHAMHLGIANNISFLGHKCNPFPYMKKCDVFVLSSISEGLPNVLLEAGACGLPIISVDCFSGPREILMDCPKWGQTANEIEFGDFGVLVPPFLAADSDEPDKDMIMADAMYKISSNEVLYERYRKAIMDRVKLFSKKKYKNQFLELLDKLGTK